MQTPPQQSKAVTTPLLARGSTNSTYAGRYEAKRSNCRSRTPAKSSARYLPIDPPSGRPHTHTHTHTHEVVWLLMILCYCACCCCRCCGCCRHTYKYYKLGKSLRTHALGHVCIHDPPPSLLIYSCNVDKVVVVDLLLLTLPRSNDARAQTFEKTAGQRLRQRRPQEQR